MSSSRQKSCLGCVRSKRKCDQGLPKCRRCVARRIDCEYNGRNPRYWSQSSETNGNANARPADAVADQGTTTTSNLQLQRSPTPQMGYYIPDPFLELANNPFNLISLPLDGDDFLSPAVISDIMTNQDPDDAEVMAGAVYQARVEFAARRIAAVPRTFAETAQTTFIHRRLLQDRDGPPQPLQDALGACALYCLKTAESRAVVFADLESKARQLVAGTDPARLSGAELLPAAQALLLYQIVRLFDGDIRLRAQAEADEPTLLAWMDRLRSHHMRPLPPMRSPPLPRSVAGGALTTTTTTAAAAAASRHQPPDWLRWLLEESIRRTVLMGIVVKGLYDFLKYGSDKVHAAGLGFTAQAALWNAQSEYGWRTAYCERERLEVSIANWEEGIGKATPEDFDELGMLTMATNWGLERTAEWLGNTHRHRYGLE